MVKDTEPTGVASMIRGIKTENLGMELLSKIDNKKYYKYKKQEENEYLTAVLDVIDAKTIDKATKIFDIKSSNDINAFYNKADDPFTKSNILQMQGYFSVTGISVGEIVHCLVGEPQNVIDEQEQLLFRKLCQDGKPTEKYIKEWEKALNSMCYTDIPEQNRLASKLIERDDEIIETINATIRECRKWLNSYHEIHESFISNRYIE